MKDYATLAEIAQRTELTPRRLRYVLDHGVLPGNPNRSQGRGVERSYTLYEAFGMACAALMLKAGLRRGTVRRCLSVLCPKKQDWRQAPLRLAFDATGEVILEVGDNRNVRLSGSGILPKHNFSTQWLRMETGKALKDEYRPEITVRLDVAGLRDRLKA